MGRSLNHLGEDVMSLSCKALGASLALCGVLALAVGASAQTTPLNTVAVDLATVSTEDRSVGTVARLAGDPVGPVILRSFEAGEVTPAHRPPRDEVRLAVVVSGVMYHGLGEEVDPAVETAYEPGDVLLLAADDMYWFAARDGDASIMFAFVAPEQLNPDLLAAME